jgi:hypothetical protein
MGKWPPPIRLLAVLIASPLLAACWPDQGPSKSAIEGACQLEAMRFAAIHHDSVSSSDMSAMVELCMQAKGYKIEAAGCPSYLQPHENTVTDFATREMRRIVSECYVPE